MDATPVAEHADPLMLRGLDGIQQGQEYVRLRGNEQKRVGEIRLICHNSHCKAWIL